MPTVSTAKHGVRQLPYSPAMSHESRPWGRVGAATKLSPSVASVDMESVAGYRTPYAQEEPHRSGSRIRNEARSFAYIRPGAF